MKVKELFQANPEACKPGLRIKCLFDTDKRLTVFRSADPRFDFAAFYDDEARITHALGHWNLCENEVVLNEQNKPVHRVYSEGDQRYLESQQNPDYSNLGTFYPSFQNVTGDLSVLIPRGLRFKIDPIHNSIVQDFGWLEGIQVENKPLSSSWAEDITLRKLALRLVLSAIFAYNCNHHYLWFQKYIYSAEVDQKLIYKLQHFFEDLGTFGTIRPIPTTLNTGYQVQAITRHVLGISPYPNTFKDTMFTPEYLFN